MNNDKKNKKETNNKKTPNIKVTYLNEPNLDIVFKALKNLSTTSNKK
ncbi:hypothetical protein [Gottfriedia luciferensis]|nr:hypothetical protein [Gottfriedia luciferensis]